MSKGCVVKLGAFLECSLSTVTPCFTSLMLGDLVGPKEGAEHGGAQRVIRALARSALDDRSVDDLAGDFVLLAG